MGLDLYFLLHTAMPCQQASELEDVADPLSRLVQVGHGLRNGSWIKRTLPEVRNTQPAKHGTHGYCKQELTKLIICPLRRSVVNLTSQPYQYRIARQKLEKLNSGFWQSCTFLHLRERECNCTAGSHSLCKHVMQQALLATLALPSNRLGVQTCGNSY